MSCEEFQERLADYLAASLGEAAAAELHTHLADCAACRSEAASLRKLWSGLGALEVEQPSPALRSRFYESLAAYKRGLAEDTRPRPALLTWLGGGRPVLQFAWSLLVLGVGLAAGHLLTAHRDDAAEITRLQREIGAMHQMVTLSLLQQQSASERLRGVDWGARSDQSDTQVLEALLSAASHDPNVNVRLAAVDALRRFAANPAVVSRVDQALPRQDSPLVQIAMIDLLVGMRDRHAAPSLQALVRNASANEEVRARAEWGLRHLR